MHRRQLPRNRRVEGKQRMWWLLGNISFRANVMCAAVLFGGICEMIRRNKQGWIFVSARATRSAGPPIEIAPSNEAVSAEPNSLSQSDSAPGFTTHARARRSGFGGYGGNIQ